MSNRQCHVHCQQLLKDVLRGRVNRLLAAKNWLPFLLYDGLPKMLKGDSCTLHSDGTLRVVPTQATKLGCACKFINSWLRRTL